MGLLHTSYDMYIIISSFSADIADVEFEDISYLVAEGDGSLSVCVRVFRPVRGAPNNIKIRYSLKTGSAGDRSAHNS